MSNFGKRRWELLSGGLAAIALAIAATVCPVHEAHAAFICDSTTPGGADGANGNGFACGTAATATNAQDTSIGINSKSTGGFGTAVGTSATASGLASSAVGSFATASGAFANSFGELANATGGLSSAFGSNAQATGDNSTAVGVLSIASANGTTALGVGASAQFANSAAIGSGATATRADQVMIGTATNTYTLAGVNSAASLAAQTGPTKFVTSDAAGNLATTNFSPQDITGLQSNVGALQNNVAVLNTQMRQSFEGTAIAIAMGGSALPAEKKFAVSSNWGTFRGQNAGSLFAQARVSQNVVLNGGVGFGFAQGGVGGRAGMTVAW